MRYPRLFAAALGCLLAAGPAVAQHEGHELGEVDFPTSCSQHAQEAFHVGLAQLHHMMYEQARPHFQATAEADPQCAMAHWGIAMTSFTPFWGPPSPRGLERGKEAVEQARALGAPTARELDYITAAAAFFTDPEPPAPDRHSDNQARLQAWKEAQRELHQAYPEDADAGALYALAQVSTAPPLAEDPEHTALRRARALIERHLAEHPRHPGLHHYLLHASDNPELAPKAEEVAHAYDRLAPNTPHALHMPSHIFSRLGMWEEVAEWNERSAEAAARQPLNGMTSMHYPHALDYMMFAYLQLGEEAKARQTLERIEAIEKVEPIWGSSWGIAAARARYYVEREDWDGAATLEPDFPAALPWENFPAEQALVRYARGLGAARVGDLEQAEAELARVHASIESLREGGDEYFVPRIEALAKTVEAWIAYEQGETEVALERMAEAADLEDSMEVTPVHAGPIRDARELYGQMLLREGRADEALVAFQTSLERVPNRTHAVSGIERARDTSPTHQ